MLVTSCTALSGIPALDSQDGQIYRRHCSGCHGVPDPRFRTFDEWQLIMPDMERRIREKRLTPISDPEREAILRYLKSYGKGHAVRPII